MSESSRRRFVSKTCIAPACGLSFPVDEHSPLGDRCPVCSAPTRIDDPPFATSPIVPTAVCFPLRLEVLLDNVRSLSNVGSVFRSADGIGVAHLHLGGITPTPRHPKLAKTALGAESWIPWTHSPSTPRAAADLHREGATLWALEGGDDSESLFGEPLAAVRRLDRLVLVCGHEVSGIDPRVLEHCARRVHLPMFGRKESLNVAVAMAVAGYAIRCAAGNPGFFSPPP